MEPYDYLPKSLMSQEDIDKMVEINPYNRTIRMFFRDVETSEHKQFNKVYAAGFATGAYRKVIEMAKLLREKGMPKEEVRLLINKALGEEVVKPSKTEVHEEQGKET